MLLLNIQLSSYACNISFDFWFFFVCKLDLHMLTPETFHLMPDLSMCGWIAFQGCEEKRGSSGEMFVNGRHCVCMRHVFINKNKKN